MWFIELSVPKRIISFPDLRSSHEFQATPTRHCSFRSSRKGSPREPPRWSKASSKVNKKLANDE